MATQQVRNIVNNQLDSLLDRLEIEIRNEGKKKLDKLKEKLMSPDTITKTLQVDPTTEACSERGIDKYSGIKSGIMDNLTKLENRAKSSKEKLTTIEGKITPIIEGDGPLGMIKHFRDNIIRPTVMPALKGIKLAIPVALFVLKGPLADVGIGAKLIEKLRDVNSKIKEIEGLLDSIDGIEEHYQEEAQRIIEPLNFIKSALDFVENESGKLKPFTHTLNLEYEGRCNELNNASNISVQSDTMTGMNENENSSVLPNPDGPTPLQEYLALLEAQYNDVYSQLLAAGNTKARERVFALKETLEEDYNIRFRTINL